MTTRQTGRENVRVAELRAEQAYVAMLYERLDEARRGAEQALAEVYGRGGAGGTHQARIEREVSADEHARLLSQLSGVDAGLCFGRIDLTNGQAWHIGRIGLRDEEFEPLLIDWRAPAARPFYTATGHDPGPLRRRRHLHTRNRDVIGLDDEVFDLDALTEEDRHTLVGEAALLASLRRGRTGRMRDVVATIQAEQDRIIRSPLAGALVIQGGPGTGKTVAALHRAAYLLYTHRKVLARRGVMIVGPNPVFSRYISQVLPSLGETDVVLASVGELFPGVVAQAVDAPAVAEVKGRARMAEVLRAAVRDRQRVPAGNLRVVIDGVEVVVPRETVVAARERARGSRRPHNAARGEFVRVMLRALLREQARVLGRPLDEEELRYGPRELWAEAPVRRALNALWPDLTPQRLVGELLSDEGLLAAACRRRDGDLAPDADEGGTVEGGAAGDGRGGSGRRRRLLLGVEEQEVLLREAGAAWTVEDVPLLDEAAELLGEDPAPARAARRAAERERAAQASYARGVLQVTGMAGEDEADLDAGMVAARYAAGGPALTTAERAVTDREWAFGHVIVDEAQELSAMAWRCVLRRVPTRSLTIVGDVAQTGAAAGTRSWAQMLDPHLKGRWRLERLSVNYRTPAAVMEVAAAVLASYAPGEVPPESAREGEEAPRAVRAPVSRWPRVLPEVVAEEAGAVGAALGPVTSAAGRDGGAGGEGTEGRVAVIAPAERCAAVAGMVPGAVVGGVPEALDAGVVVMSPAQVKGLEFDAVVVVAPEEMLAGSAWGGHDLYVALTRTTRRLVVLHDGELPAVLAGLVPQAVPGERAERAG